MTETMPIFVQPESSVPIAHIANPVRVDRPGRTDNPAYLDLVALATIIVAREADFANLSRQLLELREDHRAIRARLERVESERDRIRSALRTLADVHVPGYDRDDDDSCGCSDCVGV